MSTHYIDITLLPDPEFSHAHLLGALVSKLHRALVQLQASDIGISFPRYSLHPRSLGQVLRLHGTAEALGRLLAQPWLQGMRDHVRLAELAVAPAQSATCLVQRRQFKTNAERLRRRRMRRKGESAEQAAAAIPASIERAPNLPFVQLHSASTGQAFCLFVEQTILTESQATSQGGFNTYGLSHGTTVPWF
ncbi:MAG TPA: type I-F CRISPR-associated endoribonuclease Cas6/Csy4 [Burkholderiaceae bacterium]